ncbi:MAG: hypothetical protein HKN21_00255, partial [Candidatus Eisenbacteria bacterium]|nr:hypothetical protein [Candidatus Eisenbacteria bacterium]
MPAPLNTDPVVFRDIDSFASGLDFQAFAGSKIDALSIDTETKFTGGSSLRITVPPTSGGYAGGAFTANSARSFAGYDALTFYAKASKESSLDVVGLGNDNTGNSLYTAERASVPLTTSWTKYIVPIPLPSRLTNERGLMYFAEAAEGDGTEGHTIWFDEVVFENTGLITNPRPILIPQVINAFVGGEVNVTMTQATFAIDGVDQRMSFLPGYYDFFSDDDAVAVSVDGMIVPVGAGTATLTAKLGDVDAVGSVTLNVTAPPTERAPIPDIAAADVISLFSNEYDNVPVDTWSTPWDDANVADIKIDGDDVKVYTEFGFAGIEFLNPTIDATEMTHFHMNVWVEEARVVGVKLVDFGPDNAFGGGDDTEHESLFGLNTDPGIVVGEWFTLDL